MNMSSSCSLNLPCHSWYGRDVARPVRVEGDEGAPQLGAHLLAHRGVLRRTAQLLEPRPLLRGRVREQRLDPARQPRKLGEGELAVVVGVRLLEEAQRALARQLLGPRWATPAGRSIICAVCCLCRRRLRFPIDEPMKSLISAAAAKNAACPSPAPGREGTPKN